MASVHRRVSLLASKNERIGAIVSNPLAVLNAWSWSADQMKSFFVLRRGKSGATCRCMATASVLAESWFANPKKEQRSVRLVGVGNWEIASVIDWSIL